MGKVLFITGILYLLYYAGNVVYDLFIKKPPIVLHETEGEIISLGAIMTEEPITVKNIREEEVEDLNTPESFQIDDEENLFSDHQEDDFRKDRFEEENEIEKYAYNTSTALGNEEHQTETESETETSQSEDEETKNSFLSKLGSAIGISEKDTRSKTTEVIPTKLSDEAFRNFFEKASNHVVINQDKGQQFYTSSLAY